MQYSMSVMMVVDHIFDVKEPQESAHDSVAATLESDFSRLGSSQSGAKVTLHLFCVWSFWGLRIIIWHDPGIG